MDLKESKSCHVHADEESHDSVTPLCVIYYILLTNEACGTKEKQIHQLLSTQCAALC